MGRAGPLRRLGQQGQSLTDLERGAHALRQRTAFDHLHHEEGTLGGLPEVEHPDHVEMRDAGDRLGLAEEPDKELGVLRVPAGEELDRYGTVETLVGRPPYLRHPASTERRVETVPILYEVPCFHHVP
jgi:hypothetical protein